MAIFKCKMCGGTIEFEPGDSVGVCAYCGTKQTLPNTSDDVITNLYNRANNLRLKSEFDRAQKVYEDIVNKDDSQAEAHWGIVLCKYGIEYVDDPATGKKIPTCHRTSYEAIRTDADYLAATDYADGEQQAIYEAEAREIDKIQKGILAIAKEEKPFDVFICYKETDESGNRTVDSTIANDIYYQLTQEGFKVFYAAITLEDKLGQEYEPYIFAALNSAKVMLAIGTKPEYFNAVWVKNEWSRYLKLMKADRNRLLIPCYRDMDAYDLPEEFAHLQAQDMSKIGFISDVVRGIKKVLVKEEAPATTTAQTFSNENGNVTALLDRGFMALEDGEWQRADDFFEQALNFDAKLAEAYLGKLMAELRVRKREDLKHQKEPFLQSGNYQKACKFDETIREELEADIIFIKQRKEEERKEGIYRDACNLKKQAKSESDYIRAATMFEQIAGYKDADKLVNLCREEAQKITEEESKIIDSVAKAIQEKTTLTMVSALKEQLVTQKAKLSKLLPLVQNFESIACDIRKAKPEVHTINEELEKLKSKRASLGLFAGKEKKQTDAEITDLTNKKATVEATIKNKTEELQGFATKQALESKIEQIKSKIAALEAKIQESENEESIEFTYLQATALYRADESIRNKFNTKYPELVETIFAIIIELGIKSVQRISAGYSHTVGLKADSTVVAVGYKYYGECDVSDWKGIVAVAAGNSHTVGLKADGTVVAVGYKMYGQCDVSDWKGIISVAAGENYTVGIKTDGTVVSMGNNEYGQCDVTDWKDIIAVAAGNDHTVGLKADGTVVAVGCNKEGQCDVSGWKDIVAVAAGYDYTVGVKIDGTVVAVGGNYYGRCDVTDWKDIISVSAGDYHTVGLKADSTVVAVGVNDYGQCDVTDWKDIVAVATGEYHTIGLKADGTVVAVGNNEDGQCDVSDWKDIKVK